MGGGGGGEGGRCTGGPDGSLTRKESSATKFDRVEMAFIFALFHWLKPLNNKGREETGLLGDNPL